MQPKPLTPRMATLRRSAAKTLASGLFSGFLPRSPGTWGSLAFLVIWYALKSAGLLQSITAQLLLLSAIALAGLWSTAECLKGQSAGNSKAELDPPFIVIDEWLGMMISLLGVEAQNHAQVISAFILFRCFDIFKPGPVRKAEKFPGAWGIMADDALAGVFAALALQLINRI